MPDAIRTMARGTAGRLVALAGVALGAPALAGSAAAASYAVHGGFVSLQPSDGPRSALARAGAGLTAVAPGRMDRGIARLPVAGGSLGSVVPLTGACGWREASG